MEEKEKVIEEEIDKWLPDMLDKEIPRYKYIYHCQCAYLDLMIDKGLFFSSADSVENQCIFSLNYNIHIAYKYLREDNDFSYEFDSHLYMYAYSMLCYGLIYAKLCEIFPRVHSNKLTMTVEGKHVSFSGKEYPRRKNRLMDYYLFRKPLSYLLQNACGVSGKMEEIERQLFLVDIYKQYWGENVWNDDYEPYTAVEGGGIREFFLITAMKRFMTIYDNDFDMKKVRLSQVLVLFSKEGAKKIRTFIPTENDHFYNLAFEDCIYKPLGNTDFPKANIADAPLIRTNNGCIFTNPLGILFNNSMDTQFLNYLRRHDNERFLIIKDKIKERCIPQIKYLLTSKIPNLKECINFEVRIPGQKKNKRELDYLIVDGSGIAIYLEFKHFYIPESVGEAKILDSEFTKAIKKMPNQLNAIRQSWNILSQQYELPDTVIELYGIVVSYMYTGSDVAFSEETPLVNMSLLANAISHSNSIKEMYEYCKTVEKVYQTVPTITRKEIVNYAGYEFEVEDIALVPEFETKINEMLRKQIQQKFINGGHLQYVPYLAIDYKDVLNIYSEIVEEK